MNHIKDYIKLIRVKHWLKNFLIFIPLMFSTQILVVNKLLLTLIGFISFCFISSTVYIINDLNDVKKDRKHPIKKKRPIASGAVSKKEAIVIAGILFLISVLLNIFVIKELVCLIFILLYLLLNICYSRGLKNVAIVDVVILVSGFVIRVVYGAFINGIIISNWLYLTVMAGSFFMGFGKRRNEAIKQGSKSRKVLKYYTKEYLDKFMYICLILAIVFYSLWSIDVETIDRIGNNYMIYTIPFLLVIVMRYCLHMEGDSFGEPIDIITSDKVLISLISVFVFSMFLIVYVL